MQPQSSSLKDEIKISHFLRRKFNTNMYFKRFLLNGAALFPVNPGYCLIFQQCSSPQCYIFVHDKQLTISIVPALMKKQKFACHICNKQRDQDNLIVDASLRSLMQRNFNLEQLFQLKTILITPNLQVIPQLEDKWQYIQSQKNTVRLNYIMKYQEELQKDPKLLLCVKTRDIYNQLKKKSHNIEVQLHKVALTKENKAIQFCILEPLLEPRILHCYNGNLAIYKIANFQNIHFNQAKCCSIAFQKNTKNLFYLNHNKQIYYSNISKHTDKQLKLITFIKVGKLVSQQYNKIIVDTKLHLYKNVLYIVGGEHQVKNINDVLYCDMTQYITDIPQNHQIKFSVYSRMKEYRRFVGSDIFTSQDKHYLLIYGGRKQQKRVYGAQKKEQLSKTIECVELKPKNPTERVLQMYQIQSYLPLLSYPVVVCYNAENFVVFGGYDIKRFNDSLYIVKMDIRQKKSEFTQQKINGLKSLKSGEAGCGGSSDKEIIILSKQQQIGMYQEQKLFKLKLKWPQFNQALETIALV